MNHYKKVLLLFGGLLLILFIYGFYQAKKIVYPPRILLSDFHAEWGDKKNPEEYGLKYQNISFRLNSGEPLLSGWYVKGTKTNTAVVVVEGWGQNRNKALRYTSFFNKLGYPVLTFDFRGQGASEGKLCTLGYQESKDIAAAVKYLLEEKKTENIILFGVSMGGVASLLYASENNQPEIKAIIVDSIYYNFKMLIRDKIHQVSPLLIYPLANFINLSASFFMKLPVCYIDLNQAQNVNVPVLIIHSSSDREIPVSQALKLKKILKKSKIVLIDNAPHGENFKTDQKKYKRTIIEFLKD